MPDAARRAPRIHDFSCEKQAAVRRTRLSAVSATLLFAAAALLGLTAPAAAFELTKSTDHAEKAPPPMTFKLGRLPGSKACGQDCVDFIVAEGEIGFGSGVAYLLARKRIGDRPVPVLLNSPGGYVVGATNLARLWRRLGATVIIARADIRPCGGAGEACSPEDEAAGVGVYDVTAAKSECASACPFALSGAITRIAPEGANVGVHESYIDESEGLGKAVSGVLSEAEKASARRESEQELEAFATEMGIDPEIARRGMKTAHNSMDWLSAADVERYRLSTGSLAASSLSAALIAALAPEPRAKPARRGEKSAVGEFTKRVRR